MDRVVSFDVSGASPESFFCGSSIGVELSEISELTPESVHLFHVRTENAIRQEWLTRHSGLLSRYENERHRRFVFQKDRDQYLIARVLLRSTLSRYLSVKPGDLHFQKNEYGKPELDTGRAQSPVRFNVSHCTGLVLCGVTLGCEIGVDCENIRRKIELDRLAQKVLSADEQEFLASVNASSRTETFFRFWTLKEAYVKARGLGMAMPLQGCAFDLADKDLIRVCFGPQIEDRPQMWQFLAPDFGDPFQAAVAVNVPSEAKLQVEVREAIY